MEIDNSITATRTINSSLWIILLLFFYSDSCSGSSIRHDGSNKNKLFPVTTEYPYPGYSSQSRAWWETGVIAVLGISAIIVFVVAYVYVKRFCIKAANPPNIEPRNSSPEHRRHEIYAIQPIVLPTEFRTRSLPHANMANEPPPSYEIVILQPLDFTRPKKNSHIGESFESDISIVELPPPYFAIAGKVQTTES